MKITGNIITLNEAHNIKDCIISMKDICDEIIVVDSNSTDETVNIAKELGVKVIIQDYLGDGPQKNVVIEHASYDWILSMDADERLDIDMIEKIRSIKIRKEHPNAYSFKRKNYIGKRWIKYCGWYPDTFTRLYNKTKTKWKDIPGHSYIETKNVEIMDAHIIHYSYKNYHELLYKTNRFSTRGAKILLDKNKKINSLTPFLHGLSAFIKTYIIKKGFLQGLDGLTVSILAALNSYIKYAKYLEMLDENERSDSLWEQ